MLVRGDLFALTNYDLAEVSRHLDGGTRALGDPVVSLGSKAAGAGSAPVRVREQLTLTRARLAGR